MGDVNLYNPHDGLTGRDGGPYLDEVERRNAETIRAAKEGREPDYDNAAATAGTPLVTGPVLAQIANPASNPSQQQADPMAAGVQKLVDDEDHPLTAFTTRPETEEEEAAKEAESKGPLDNPASPLYSSTDPENSDGQKNSQDTGSDSSKSETPDLFSGTGASE